jgi:hypothetical protein
LVYNSSKVPLLKYGAGAGFMHLAQETSTMFLWHLTEMLLPYLEERANTFVSSINQHYCPLVLQEVELALFPFLAICSGSAQKTNSP